MKKNKDSRPLKTQFKALQISIVVLHHIATFKWSLVGVIDYLFIIPWYFLQKSPSLWLLTPRLLCRSSPQASTGLCAASLCVRGTQNSELLIWWDAREHCSMMIGRISWWPWNFGGFSMKQPDTVIRGLWFLFLWKNGNPNNLFNNHISDIWYVGLTWKSNWEKHISSNLIKSILSNPRFTFQANNQSNHQSLERQGANVSSSTTCA